MSKPVHNHFAHQECTERCPAFDPNGWRCGCCNRQRPMMADTEDWDAGLCDECWPEKADA